MRSEEEIRARLKWYRKSRTHDGSKGDEYRYAAVYELRWVLNDKGEK